MAGVIAKAGRRLHRMVENYLLHVGMELARLTAAPPATGAFAGDSGAAEVGPCALERAREHGREADVDLDLADVSLPVAPPYAGKIVSELVDNALKFSERGQRIRVTLAASGGKVTLEVADHGRGLTADELAQLGAFRQFNRVLFEQQGSGLGLALVKGVIEASLGTLEILSTPGEGTTARASWPY